MTDEEWYARAVALTRAASPLMGSSRPDGVDWDEWHEATLQLADAVYKIRRLSGV